MSDQEGANDPATDLADRLHSAAIHLLRHLRQEDDASGLTAPRLSALSVIVFRGPLTVGELAHAEQVRPPTISRLVSDLEEQGLVGRREDPEDRRVRWVEATKKGQRLLHQGRRRRVDRLAQRLRSLSGNDKKTLTSAAALLEQLVRP
ncbi:MAG: MarR family transcriptional regulator [Gemmatimonadetes bacterium]|nr:MarR family transcriptional regulator [Gemmatimonadota bacterium]